MNRRNFIKGVGAGIALSALGNTVAHAFGSVGAEDLVILHTNDFHSRMEPFPAGDPKYGGRGGVAARMKLIQEIRSKHKNVLLVDAGDIFQGTPYFNLFGGEPEIRAMNEMGYDATAIGNHDFDAGLEGLERAIDRAEFPYLSHYQFQGTLKGKVHPWKIIQKGRVKVGVFGLGINPKGLISPSMFGDTRFSDPIAHAKEMVEILRSQGVDLVVCLSHLGYQYSDGTVSDVVLAEKVEGIDFVIGGHTHTFLEQPTLITHGNRSTWVCQAGWAGLAMGRIDVKLHSKKVYFWQADYTQF
ncbi:MAG: hypothetical protein RIS99_1686 [Bacteroidota bacterium]|jgi:5'-nucleotidase